MNEQTKQIVGRSLNARIAQCATQLEMLRAYPNSTLDDTTRAEHAAYWINERQAAFAALQELSA